MVVAMRVSATITAHTLTAMVIHPTLLNTSTNLQTNLTRIRACAIQAQDFKAALGNQGNYRPKFISREFEETFKFWAVRA